MASIACYNIKCYIDCIMNCSHADICNGVFDYSAFYLWQTCFSKSHCFCLVTHSLVCGKYKLHQSLVQQKLSKQILFLAWKLLISFCRMLLKQHKTPEQIEVIKSRFWLIKYCGVMSVFLQAWFVKRTLVL